MICKINSDQVAAHWHEIEPFLFDHFEWTPAEVRQQLESAKAQLWVLAERRIRGIVITKLMAPIGLIWIASGKGLDSESMKLLAIIEQWMKEKGCRFVKIEGRRGWGRVLDGYEEKATVFLKRLQ